MASEKKEFVLMKAMATIYMTIDVYSTANIAVSIVKPRFGARNIGQAQAAGPDAVRIADLSVTHVLKPETIRSV